jgi:tRNA(Ser,Leu) C12 N-acetylase TAN1
MADDSTSPGPGWNIVVTCRHGGQRAVRRALHPLVRLRPSGFRNVLVGRVDDVPGFLAAVAALLERRPSLQGALGKLTPVDHTFVVDVPRFHEQLAAEATKLVDRLVGQSFHVRVERRGHKGIINTQAAEQALGEALYSELETRGTKPTVTFTDPDAVVLVELIGEFAGLTLVTRDLRQRFSFIRVD